MRYAALKAALTTVLMTVILSANNGALAANPNGWCLPATACMGAERPIKKNHWSQCEAGCGLSSPVAVRDMDATLYDVTCSGDSGSISYRALFVFTEDYDGSREMLMLTNSGIQKMQECAQ